MSAAGFLRSVAWATAGALLVGGGMFLGFVSALIERKQAEGLSPAPKPGMDLDSARKLQQLEEAVENLRRRVLWDQATPRKLDEVSLRVEQLERRLDQMMAGEGGGLPPVDHLLNAVEHLVAGKLGSLDERLDDQVHAIELLRNASKQTDALLGRLIAAVEALTEKAAEARPRNGSEDDLEVPFA